MVRRGTSASDVIDRFTPSEKSPIGDFDGEIQFGGEYEDSIIPDYLEPIGNTGIWVTPDDPADPMDCERYPASPWCGGTGVDPGSIGMPVGTGIDPSYSANACEVCLILDASLFWIAVPQTQICYRSKNPDCQPPQKDPPPPPPGPPPGPPGGPPGGGPVSGPKSPPGCYGAVQYRSWSVRLNNNGGGRLVSTDIFYWTSQPIRNVSGFWTTVVGSTYYIAVSGITPVSEPNVTTTGWSQSPHSSVGYDRWGNTYALPAPSFVAFYPQWDPDDPVCRLTRSIPPQPPPPKPPKRCPCMCCSNSQNKNLEKLLKLVAQRLGVYDYPVSVPGWLVSEPRSGQIQQQSLTSLTVWLIQQLDALAGEFPVKLTIEDDDPTQKGDQKKEVKLPNIAEALAEIYGLAAKSAIDSDVHTSFLMRLAAETMAAKTAALIAQDYASANASYLGYKGNAVKRRVQYAFDPTRLDSLETILTNSTQDVAGWENQDRDNVADYLQRLMFASGVIKSVFFRKKSDFARLVTEMKEFFPGSGGIEDKQWDDFLDQINNSESPINKGSQSKPEIRNLNQKS